MRVLLVATFLILPILTCILRADTPPAATASTTSHRGGRVAWARIVTGDPQWHRHTRSDGDLSAFIRTQTSLNLDPTWFTARPADLAELCTYPLLFSTDLTSIKKPAEQANLREYLARGGFIFVDACINTRDVNPSPDRFLANNRAVFATLLPGSEVKPLGPDHAIYQCYFEPRDKPPHSYMDSVYDPAWARHPLYGVYHEDRMVAVISLSGLQCGWDRMTAGDHATQCMQMVVNIYVHAMTRP